MKKYKIIHYSPKYLNTKQYSDFIGSFFINQDYVLNICNTEEDIIMSNRWFNNRPVRIAVTEKTIFYAPKDSIIIVDYSSPSKYSKLFRVLDYATKSMTCVLQNIDTDEVDEYPISMLINPIFKNWAEVKDKDEIFECLRASSE